VVELPLKFRHVVHLAKVAEPGPSISTRDLQTPWSLSTYSAIASGMIIIYMSLLATEAEGL
jgi:hypothetical protein